MRLPEGFLPPSKAGLRDDVKKLPAVGLYRLWNLLRQGKRDVAMGGIGGGPNKDMNAKIPSGMRYWQGDRGSRPC